MAKGPITILVYDKETDDLLCVEYAETPEGAKAMKVVMRAKYGDGVDIVVKPEK